MSAYDILLSRGVTRLCHFTKLQSRISFLLSRVCWQADLFARIRKMQMTLPGMMVNWILCAVLWNIPILGF